MTECVHGETIDEFGILDDREPAEDPELEMFLFGNPEFGSPEFENVSTYSHNISLKTKYRNVRGPLTYAEATAPDD